MKHWLMPPLGNISRELKQIHLKARPAREIPPVLRGRQTKKGILKYCVLLNINKKVLYRQCY